MRFFLCDGAFNMTFLTVHAHNLYVYVFLKLFFIQIHQEYCSLSLKKTFHHKTYNVYMFIIFL